MTKIETGQTFQRKRGFRRADEGHPGRASWWLIRVRNYPGEAVTGYGAEFVEVVEVVETATFGPLVIYRHWIVDPDGNELRRSFTPRRDEHLFRPADKFYGAIRTMQMELVKPDLPKAA